MEDIYLSREFIKINKLYRELSLDKDKLQKMVDEGLVHCITTKRGMKYLKKDLDNYIRDLRGFYDSHYALSDFIQIDLDHKLNTKIKNSVEKFFKGLGYEIVVHKGLANNKMNRFLKIEDYNDFNKNYIKYTDFFDIQIKTRDPERLAKYLRANKIKLHKLALQYKYTYLYRRELEKLGPIKSDLFIRKEEVKKRLGLLKAEYINELLWEYGIKELLGNGHRYILTEDAEFLFKEQCRTLNEYKEKYYTSKQVRDLYEGIGRRMPKFIHKLPKVQIPHIARIEDFKGNTFIYEKVLVDAHLEDATASSALSDVIHNLNLSREEVFFKILDIKNVFYQDNYSETFVLWLTHSKRKFALMSGDELNTRYNISQLCNVTSFINDISKIKELNLFSAKELKFMVENRTNHVEKVALAIFVREANKMYKEKGLEIIKWDYKVDSVLKKSKEPLYTLAEYFELIDFAANNSYHLKNIAFNYSNNTKNVEVYSSYWFYIILHLNNALRKSDIIKFKKIQFNVLGYLNVKSFEHLASLNITKEQVQFLKKVFQKEYLTHSKNFGVTKLNISETLIESFILAYCGCLLSSVVEKETIINFHNKSRYPSQFIEREFFKDFKIKEFKFKSRKMNATFLSIIDNVMRNYEGIDGVSIAKYARGHFSIETTNRYIQLSEEELNKLSELLFENGNFGYIYKLIESYYFNNEFSNNEQLDMKFFENTFGHLIKVETNLRKIVFLENRMQMSKKYINTLSDEEINRKFKQLSYGLNHIKDVNYQCLFEKCLNHKYDCEICPFAIPNWYVLINIKDRIIENTRLYLHAQKKRSKVGTLKKLYNNLIQDVTKLIEASERLGREIMEYLLECPLDEFLNELSKLPDPNIQKERLEFE